MVAYLQANGLLTETGSAALAMAGLGATSSGDQPQAPSVPLRLPLGMPAILAARSARREGQFDVAANPKLTNTTFYSNTG